MNTTVRYRSPVIRDVHEVTTRPGEDDGVHVEVPRVPAIEVCTPSVEELLDGLEAGWT